MNVQDSRADPGAHGSSGEWVVLEVGTDGLYNHFDRELNNPRLESELLERIAAAFWHKAKEL
jgi:hypothetical protein